MNTRIKTNRIIYSLDHKAIREHYDFFSIETSEKYIKGGAYILDAPALNDGIKSIQYESGRRAYVMLEHEDSSRSLLVDVIKNNEERNDLSVEKCRCEDIPDHLLLQLLFNSLSSYDSEVLRFSNLTGHLYCSHPDWIKHGKERLICRVPSLELKVHHEYLLELYVRTFTSTRLKNKITFGKKRFEEYPQYVFSKGNTLRRKLAEETDESYILRQVDGKKSEIPFLDIQNEKNFEKTKVGVLNKVVSTFNKKYEGLAHIDFGYFDVTSRIDYKKSAAKENDKAIRKQLSDIGVHIMDMIDDEYSKIFCSEVKGLFQKKYGVEASVGKRVKKDRLNICVIHNANYYDSVDDPHDKDYPEVALQHITLEDFAGNSEFAVSTVAHEMLIKNDLKNGQISLFDWTTLDFDEDISFGVEDEIDGINRYFFMKIHPDGSFDIKERELNLFEMDEYNECAEIFEDARTRSEHVKGIIRDSHGNISVIKDTGMYTLPEAEAIEALLKLGDTKLRGKARREELLSSCLDIKMYEEDGAKYYFVGTIGEGMRWKIQRAANIRLIEGYKGKSDMFERLLLTMCVTFVQNGQLTVLPFPFKYLREYTDDAFS